MILGLQLEVLDKVLSVFADIEDAVDRQFQLLTARAGEFIILIGKDAEFEAVRTIIEGSHRSKELVILDAIDQGAFFTEKLDIKVLHFLKELTLKVGGDFVVVV
ncbi:MAG: hypothetical protein BWY95_02348 [Bacteroidetes bacterium ADurb.BinA104]|nr:MAG: hypothetical protein BWY95_02348 [Bacteroidetes bacterium ADurb.BinA104]